MAAQPRRPRKPDTRAYASKVAKVKKSPLEEKIMTEAMRKGIIETHFVAVLAQMGHKPEKAALMIRKAFIEKGQTPEQASRTALQLMREIYYPIIRKQLQKRNPYE